MMDTAKKAFFAAVGAPVVMTRHITDKAMELNTKAIDFRTKVQEDAQKRYDEYATEGEKWIDELQEQKVVEDLTSRVDFDQIQEQVGKLRGQLEDMVGTWREAFLPEEEKVEKVKVEVEEAPKPAAKPAAKKPAAKKTTTAAKKPAAKKTTSTAAQKPAAKKAAPKKAAASTKK